MVTLVASKVAEQPASQSWPMESKEWGCRSGKTWAWRAEAGRVGMLSWAEEFDSRVLPSGRETVIGVSVGWKAGVCGGSKVRKWPVLPVSAMTLLRVGRPREGQRDEGMEFKMELIVDSLGATLAVLGSPRPQLAGVVGVVAELALAGVVVVRGGRTYTAASPFLRWMTAHPPHMFWRVAVR
jgi:hypothetical protein